MALSLAGCGASLTEAALPAGGAESVLAGDGTSIGAIGNGTPVGVIGDGTDSDGDAADLSPVFLTGEHTAVIGPTGALAATAVKGNQMKRAIRAIISQVTHVETYDELRQDLAKTDPGDKPGTVRLFYSGEEVNSKWDSGNTWNREHVWPKSRGWYKNGGAGADIHHIRPDSPSGNSSRGNTKFGEGASYYCPPDEVKGDIARIIFYMLTRYSETDTAYPVTNVAQSMDILLKWNRLDPVDKYETVRNNEAYAIQGNRNPFIDCPALAESIWGSKAS